VISFNNVDLKALLLTQGVIVATCLSSFVGARQLAPEPSASSPSASSSSSSSSSLCSRAIANTLWGSTFAFFSLMADRWPAHKAETSLWVEASSLGTRLFTFFVVATVTPLYGISELLKNLSMTLRFRQIVTSSINPELAADTRPCFSKNTRMAASTHIVLGISDSSTLPPTHLQRSDYPVKEENIADALTIGHKTGANSCLMELNVAGKLALLESSILPDCKQFRFLDARSGIATLIICVQASGYVISIAYRAILHLPVSPIEAIGFSFSMFVIVHSVVHSLGAISQCPLVVYLLCTQEQEMIDKCKSTQSSDADELICEMMRIWGMFVVVSVVVVFTMLVERELMKRRLLDKIGPILFLSSLITTQCIESVMRSCRISLSKVEESLTLIMIPICVWFGIVVSIVATILNWHTNKFDSRTPSVIHNLPFLG
jgi:hypothetical protein